MKENELFNDDSFTIIDYLNIINIRSYLSTDKNKIPKKYYKVFYKAEDELFASVIAANSTTAIQVFRKHNKSIINSIQVCEFRNEDINNIVEFAKDWNAHCEIANPKGIKHRYGYPPVEREVEAPRNKYEKATQELGEDHYL